MIQSLISLFVHFCRPSSDTAPPNDNLSCQNSETTVSFGEKESQSITTSDIVIHASPSEAAHIDDPAPYDETHDKTDLHPITEIPIKVQGKESQPTDSKLSTDPSSTMPVIKIIQALGECESSEENSTSKEITEYEKMHSSAVECDSRDSIDNENMDREQTDHNVFIENVGNNILKGCVAPAPTPVPVMAPLAEDEIYNVDEDKTSMREEDEEEEDEVDVVEDKEAESEAGTDEETKEVDAGEEAKQEGEDVEKAECSSTQPPAKSPDSNSKSEESINSTNPVCPWEDE